MKKFKFILFKNLLILHENFLYNLKFLIGYIPNYYLFYIIFHKYTYYLTYDSFVRFH